LIIVKREADTNDDETKKSKSSDDQSFLSSISAQKLAWLFHSLADTAEQYER
jgi:hypothetical protein